MQASNIPGLTSRIRPDRLSARGYTQPQTFFLLRLQKLLDRYQQYVGRLRPDDWRMGLLNRALFSTYQDCVALDVCDEAQGILQRSRQGTEVG